MVISAEREPQNQMPAMRKEISAACMRSGKRNVSKAGEGQKQNEAERIRILREAGNLEIDEMQK